MDENSRLRFVVCDSLANDLMMKYCRPELSENVDFVKVDSVRDLTEYLEGDKNSLTILSNTHAAMYLGQRRNMIAGYDVDGNTLAEDCLNGAKFGLYTLHPMVKDMYDKAIDMVEFSAPNVRVVESLEKRIA